MSFCSFSKEFLSNSFTSVENQFILKYMPQSEGFTVKVYLYGLYLCSNSAPVDLNGMAEFFGCDEKKIADAFAFWEDYDLVRVISQNPFAVEYLPVATALGRPKRVRYERFGDFNKELQEKFQKVGKFLGYSDNIKYMNFLQENPIEPQAFLLIAQYCIDKKGENVSTAYIINKAKKLISQDIITYQQVEHELSGYNIHEKELINIFSALNNSKKPEEGDYTMYDRWTSEYSFTPAAIAVAAKSLKRGSMESLDILLKELHSIGKTEAAEVEAHLKERAILSDITFKVARKLSIKINSPQTYIEEFVEKWYNMGYDEAALESLAAYCTKISRNSFLEMDSLIEELYKEGIISTEAVGEYIYNMNTDLKLLVKVKNLCGGVKINSASLNMLSVWREWQFSDAMIMQAANRSASTANPLPYMNKILSDWKRNGIFKEQDIPESAPVKRDMTMEKALDDRADRERYYSELRRKAQAEADRYIKKAETNPEYVKASSALSSMNIELAKAAVFAPDEAEKIKERISVLRNRQRRILSEMGISEEQLSPAYKCKKCNDTGFLPDGKACDCYNK